MNNTTYKAHTPCPVYVTFRDGGRVSVRCGKGLELQRVSVGNLDVTATWRGDPQSVVRVSTSNFFKAFSKVA